MLENLHPKASLNTVKFDNIVADFHNFPSKLVKTSNNFNKIYTENYKLTV